MGNCCGKPSDKNFGGEGRTVDSTPKPASANNTKTSSKVPQGGRTLGSSTSGSSPREAAAKAAEERAKASQGGKGKLGKQLDAQRSQTQSDTLKQTARDNVAVRDADSGAQARQWN